MVFSFASDLYENKNAQPYHVLIPIKTYFKNNIPLVLG